MSENWDVYLALVDGRPASISVDLGLAETAPVRSQPHMALLRVVMRQPREDGLTSSEEFDALVMLEDALIDGTAASGAITYCGRSTSDGKRDFYFYASDQDEILTSIAGVMSRHSDYMFETRMHLDPDWKTYFDRLYPSVDDLQRIMNRRLTSLLTKRGDVLSKPRLIDHLAYLPDARSAANLRDLLGAHGFAVREPEVGNGLVMLRFERTDQPDTIDDVVIPIARHVKELGGAYDGWSCGIVG